MSVTPKPSRMIIFKVHGKESLRRLVGRVVDFRAEKEGRTLTNTARSFFAHVKTEAITPDDKDSPHRLTYVC